VPAAAAAASRAAVVLKTETIGGATVLANAGGLTPALVRALTPADRPATGSCAAYWPPVTGNPAAGKSVAVEVTCQAP